MGLLVLIHVSVSMLSKIEIAFNHIWRITEPRSLARRAGDYLSVILLGPLLMFTAVGLTASMPGAVVFRRLVAQEPFGTLFFLGGKLLSIGLVVAAFTFVYLYIPNTRVPWRAALLGGTVGGLAWKLAGFVFAHFISTSASYHAIYSSLVIVILFMIWLDLSWLILLLGGQAAMYFQHPQYLQGFERFQELGSRLREGLGLSLMVLIARRFVENRPPWSIDELAEQVALPWVTVKDALEVLRRGGLIEETNRAVESFLPARDIAGITVREVLGVMRSGMDDELLQCEIRCLSPQARQVLAELEQHATQSRAARLTLRELALANGR
jgi:membrane protein